MELVQSGLIVLHVLSGITALLLAPVAMIAQKGGRAHRRWGKVYFWAMFSIAATSLFLLTLRFNLFLLGVTTISVLVWIVPLALGTPALVYWINHYRTRFESRQMTPSEVEFTRDPTQTLAL